MIELELIDGKMVMINPLHYTIAADLNVPDQTHFEAPTVHNFGFIVKMPYAEVRELVAEWMKLFLSKGSYVTFEPSTGWILPSE